MSKFGVPTDEQLAKINKLAKRKLNADEVFVFPTKLAGDMVIPGRYVQLTKELLDVYAMDAKKGVSLMLDHSWHPDGFFGSGGRPKAAIPYGRTFDSYFGAATEEGETVSLMADHYMLKGVELDGIKTDDLAISIEAGTLFDTSIGFCYDKAICSVCGNNYRDYEHCKHIAGKTYEVEGEDGVTRNQVCFIKAKPPGFLMENSLVFDGAYPGAGVMSKAGDILENENGIYQVVEDIKGISPDEHMIATYSQRTGLTTLVKKSDRKKVFSGGTGSEKETKQKNVKGGEKQMDEKLSKLLETLGIEYKEGEKKADELLSQIAEKWAAIPEVEPQEGETQSYMTQDQAKEALGTEMTADEVLSLAKEGKEYRKQLIDESLAMGVRAQGEGFPAETWKTTFATMGIKQIKDIMATFEKQAKEEIPAGRQTDPAAGQHQSVSLPDDAFKVGK